jgi:hypothetical protein
MLTEAKFWHGRDVLYVHELTKEIRANARETIRRVNLLLIRAGFAERKGHDSRSGWRPRAVNAATPNAAPLSKHLLALADDVEDNDKAVQQWCMVHLDVLEELGLWMEHPRDTPTWCHLQTVPPKSGKRVFYAK